MNYEQFNNELLMKKILLNSLPNSIVQHPQKDDSIFRKIGKRYRESVC